MKEALVDTNILSLFFRGHPLVVANFTTYLAEYSAIRFSIITYYEVVSGLKHRDARKQLDSFLEFAAQSTIHPLSVQVADRTAELYADLRKRGEPIDDIDLLIAGTALANGLVLITDNRRHFDRIVELEVDNWAEAPTE
jgi:tRNA(fMet)-specific endonuclease VapC